MKKLISIIYELLKTREENAGRKIPEIWQKWRDAQKTDVLGKDADQPHRIKYRSLTRA